MFVMERTEKTYKKLIVVSILICIVTALSVSFIDSVSYLHTSNIYSVEKQSEELPINVFSPNEYNFSPKMQKVSTFSTNYSSSTSARKHNIELACDNFTWLVIKSKDKLSFNNIVGKRTTDRGYQNAKVILNGEYIEGVGGGVCQVSTTLYNAWIRADLGTEHIKAHSLPSSYCELSQDATVSEYIDMVLINTSKYDIIVNGYTKDNNLIFDIYANPLDYSIKIKSEVVGKITPQQPIVEEVDNFPDEYMGKIKQDPLGEYVLVKTGVDGYKSKAYAMYYDNQGNLIKEVLLREDTYLPRQGKILRKKQAEAEDTKSTIPWYGFR